MINPAHLQASGFCQAFVYVSASKSLMKDVHIFIIKQNQVGVQYCKIQSSGVTLNLCMWGLIIHSFSQTFTVERNHCKLAALGGVYSNHLFLSLFSPHSLPPVSLACL